MEIPPAAILCMATSITMATDMLEALWRRAEQSALAAMSGQILSN